MARTRAPGIITSLQNPTVKLVRSLASRKGRKQTEQFAVEGATMLAAAKECGWTPQILFAEEAAAESQVVRELVDWALDAGAQCNLVPDNVLAAMSSMDNPQKMIGVFSERWLPTTDISTGPDDVWIALETIRDPGNLGTVIRTADAAGAKGVILVGDCCDPFSRETVRATMGSIFRVPVAELTQQAFVELLKTWPGATVGTHLSAKDDFRTDYRSPVLLVMGSEGDGLSDQLARSCNHLVKIPMRGHVESLNLSVATAIVLYEIRRSHLRLT
jgi:TrmH family RNA methyltransferase